MQPSYVGLSFGQPKKGRLEFAGQIGEKTRLSSLTKVLETQNQPEGFTVNPSGNFETQNGTDKLAHFVAHGYEFGSYLQTSVSLFKKPSPNPQIAALDYQGFQLVRNTIQTTVFETLPF